MPEPSVPDLRASTVLSAMCAVFLTPSHSDTLGSTLLSVVTVYKSVKDPSPSPEGQRDQSTGYWDWRWEHDTGTGNWILGLGMVV